MSENEAEIAGDTDDLDAFTTGFFGQKPAEAKPAPTKADAAQELEAAVEDTAEAQTDEEDEAELEEEVKELPKKKTVQDRIDEVVRQREDLKREKDRELAELRAEIEKLKTPVQAATPSATEAQEPQPTATDKDGNPVYALGEFDPQYIRDLTRFTLQQEGAKVDAERAEAQRQSAVQQEQQALQTSWNGKLEEATKEYPDLVEKGQALLSNFNNLHPTYAGYLSTLLMQMDKGPDVLYYLSNHPSEAQSIVNSGAQKATLALGRIEAKFIEADAQKTLAKPKVSKAPAPPAERARGTNGAFISVAGDTENLDEFSEAFFGKK